MDALLTVTNNRLHVLLAPRRGARTLATLLTARLALNEGVQVLDGGNCFDVHGLARAVRRSTPRLEEALRRVQVARVFTCYQMAARLDEMPAGPCALIVLDMLATFADENVPERERLRLLTGCLAELHRLAEATPVLVTAAPAETPFRLRLEQAADVVWRED